MATAYEVDRQAAAVMALNAKHIVQQCDALLARLAVVYADHYHRQAVEDMLRGCRVLADSAAISLRIDADRPQKLTDAEQAQQAEVRS